MIIDENMKYILGIIGVFLLNSITLYFGYLKIKNDLKMANAQIRGQEGEYLLDLQQLTKNALTRQAELEKEISEYKAIKQPDFELTVVFSIIPPAIKKTSLRAVKATATRIEVVDSAQD